MCSRIRSLVYLLGVSLLGYASFSFAGPALDLDGDGLSDVWQYAFDAQDLEAAADSDGDGATNLEECEMGTDPLDANSRPSPAELVSGQDGVSFRFVGAPLQSYYLEVSDDLMNWDRAEGEVVGDGGEQSLSVLGDTQVRFARFRVGGDQDGDGISDLEERYLDFNPASRNSDESFLGGDAARLVTLLNSGNVLTINDRQIETAKPTLEEASRFLMQASLGGTMADIEEVAAMGFANWIDDQITKESGKMEPEIDQRIANDQDTFNQHRRYAWWTQIMTSDDTLRQRMAVALSEIYVVSDESLGGTAATEGIANYYDMLLDHSFGNLRELLGDVTLHPVMGQYLSHLKNRKADPEGIRFPDENFAREIMQLFTIGLFELNPDGSRRKDTSGNDIPTYDNEDITNFARVFTGLSYGGMQLEDGVPVAPKDTSEEWQFFWGSWDWDDPMLMWPNEHDMEAKTLLRGVTLPAFADDPGREPMDDVEDAVDNLFGHPNVGPFIGRKLIQRFVTSNPSPGYIQRVGQVFDDNGRGERGDLEAVLKAILLDPEARSLAAFSDPHAGRLREPYLRWVRLVKSLEARSDEGTYLIPDWGATEDLEQAVFSSRTVFNFFLPDFLPEGEMADAGLFGPEFQILTSTTAMSTQNYWSGALQWGFGQWSEENPETQLSFRFEPEIALLAAGNLEGVIDRLDLLLTYGQMSEMTRQALHDAHESMPGWYDERRQVATLVRLIVLSPDFAIFR